MPCRTLLLVAFAGLYLARLSQATPAPPPKPKKEPPEARLEVKSVSGRTAKEVAEERAEKLGQLRFAVHCWIVKRSTVLPGLSGPDFAYERALWMVDNFRMEYVKGTGVLRITCRSGTPRDAAAFVNAAAKLCIATEEEHQKVQRWALANYEKDVRDINPSPDWPMGISLRNHALRRIKLIQEWQATAPKVRLLQLAPLNDGAQFCDSRRP